MTCLTKPSSDDLNPVEAMVQRQRQERIEDERLALERKARLAEAAARASDAVQKSAEFQSRQAADTARALAAHADMEAQHEETRRLVEDTEREAAAQAARAEADTAFRKRLGGLIAAGHCDEARKSALEAGRLEDAVTVNAVCASIQPPKPARARR